MSTTISIRTILTHEVAINFLLAAVYTYFMLGFGEDFLLHKRISSLLYMLAESLMVAVFLTRKPPQALSWSKWDWFVAFIGTVTPLLLSPYENPVQYTWLAIQIFGILLSIAGLLSLNSSFGIVAANRGIKTDGMFMFVRHPIYASYMISEIALLAQNWGIGNACLLAINIAAQVARIRAEEKLLMQDDRYRLHVKKVRWRLLPGVW